jgi:hypothetical protein
MDKTINRFQHMSVLPFTAIGIMNLSAGATRSPDPLADLPSREWELVRRFLQAPSGRLNDVARVSFQGQKYLVVMNRSHRKAAVLEIDWSKKNQKNEVGARGFFVKDPQQAWVRASNEQFEMEGGIWMLNRFLQVLEKSEKGKFTSVQRQEKGANQSNQEKEKGANHSLVH